MSKCSKSTRHTKRPAHTKAIKGHNSSKGFQLHKATSVHQPRYDKNIIATAEATQERTQHQHSLSNDHEGGSRHPFIESMCNFLKGHSHTHTHTHTTNASHAYESEKRNRAAILARAAIRVGRLWVQPAVVGVPEFLGWP